MRDECEHDDTVARVEHRINLDSLPEDINHKEHVLEQFDAITAGHSLIVLDNHDLDWIEDFLNEERPETFDRRFFHLHEEAGRKEACVKKRADSE